MGNGSFHKDFGWVLVNAFIREKGLVRQHLDSYNNFIDNVLQEIVDEVGIVETEIPGVKVRLGSIEVGEPKIREADGSESAVTPMIARLRDLTYSAPIYLEMSLIVDDEERETTRVYIGEMPIMVRSSKCILSKVNRSKLIKMGEDPEDPGGYFIVNGSERVLITQEDLAVNRVLVDTGGTGSSVTHTAKVFSSTAAYRIPVTVERTKDGMLHVTIPSIPSKIPLIVMMRALGLESDKEIVNAISDNDEVIDELVPSLLEQSKIASTVEEALDYIGSRVAIGQPRRIRIERAKQILDNFFLPHIGNKPENRRDKAYFIGQMVEKLIETVHGIGYMISSEK